MNNINLTEGKIRKTLVQLALPIMATSFIQMAYNLTDIVWLGRLSTEAVAAAGTAGYFPWFGSALIMITQIGLGVSIAQLYGKGDLENTKKYISNGFLFNLVIALSYSLFLLTFRHQLIGFFNIEDANVAKMSIEYLTIVSFGVLFQFLNPIFSVTLNSTGNSITPFKANTIGLIANIVIDPIFIFGLGPIPALGIKGAAIATVTAQFFVTLIFVYIGFKHDTIYSHVKLKIKPDHKIIKQIIKLGAPPGAQIGIHAIIGMFINKILAGFGPIAIAVQSIGSQIESISWMTADGFSAAISAFVGQNFGARKLKRVRDGYVQGIQILGGIGIFTSLFLIFGAETIFSIFLPNDPAAIKEGVAYLTIIGLSQFFMTVEIGTTGAFNGLGKTLPPTINGIVLNALRIPVALLLSSTALGLDGVWWSISLSSIIKGIVIFVLFMKYWRNNETLENHLNNSI